LFHTLSYLAYSHTFVLYHSFIGLPLFSLPGHISLCVSFRSESVSPYTLEVRLPFGIFPLPFYFDFPSCVSLPFSWHSSFSLAVSPSISMRIAAMSIVLSYRFPLQLPSTLPNQGKVRPSRIIFYPPFPLVVSIKQPSKKSSTDIEKKFWEKRFGRNKIKVYFWGLKSGGVSRS
jgi:hypothetical protein